MRACPRFAPPLDQCARLKFSLPLTLENPHAVSATKSLLLAVLCLLGSLNPAFAKGKEIVLFATLLAETPVVLDDGAQWMMDKGDSFPVLMFKEQQTKLVLQLAGTRFMIPADRVRVSEDKAITPEMRANYRRNVETYLESQSKKWRGQAPETPEC